MLNAVMFVGATRGAAMVRDSWINPLIPKYRNTNFRFLGISGDKLLQYQDNSSLIL